MTQGVIFYTWYSIFAPRPCDGSIKRCPSNGFVPDHFLGRLDTTVV